MILDEIVAANRAGTQTGITSVCSAHPLVLEAALESGRRRKLPVLIEATCNQVNPQGGYTGMTPRDFRTRVTALAQHIGLPAGQLILGGDHLGPNPWRDRPGREAMALAKGMVEAYATAGFTKLHLDASMACADDDGPPDEALIAERAAQLCRAAEDAIGAAALDDRAGAPTHARARPRYVIGTEVPTPGGAHEAIDTLAVTSIDALTATLETQREAFARHGLDDAWQRTRAVVVQPGVEFGHVDVAAYEPDRARALSGFTGSMKNMVFEAHSTDYQHEAALQALVRDHFAILKVGPELTFALREALFALDCIDTEQLPAGRRANVADTLEQAMLASPGHWQPYYDGSDDDQRLARRYSLSDRCRYYWDVPAVTAAVTRLFANLTATPPHPALLSQYLPYEHAALDAAGSPESSAPQKLVKMHIDRVLARYARAAGPQA